MDSPPGRREAASAVLLIVLGSTLAVLALSLLVRAPCGSGSWQDGRQYRRLCYTDIVPLYGTERLQDGRLPYLEACPAEAGLQCDEYPVLTMYFMRLAAALGDGYDGFFYANVTLLAICGFAAAWALYRMAGVRALYFSLAPTLLIYAFVNWDLLAVALATVATLLYFRGRDAGAGVLLGLGAAAKLYPLLLVIPLALGRLRERRTEGAAVLAVWTGVTYAAVNLPFVIAAPRSWWTFFRFNAERTVDWDSLWFVACSRQQGMSTCSWPVEVVNPLSLALFAALGALVYLARRARHPDFPRWTFALPLLILFLLTNKVYSPQFGLWLLPWFALVLPNPWLFGAFSLADAAVFVTRFTWFGRLAAETGDPAFAGYSGVPIGAFQIALVVRALVLAACVVQWVRTAPEESPDEEAAVRALPAEAAA